MIIKGDIKLEEKGIYNIHRNYQELDEIKWLFDGLLFEENLGVYYLRITNFNILYKEDGYDGDILSGLSYSFIDSDLIIELTNLTVIENNLIFFKIENNKLNLCYNTFNIDVDYNFVLIGYVNRKLQVEKI